MGDKIINVNNGNPSVLNNFLSNVEYSGTDIQADNISHPVLKARFKYRSPPSTVAMKNIITREKFNFLKSSIKGVLLNKRNLNTSKTTQSTDTPAKILKENRDIL